MNCLEVRERLPEHTLSALPARESALVERHLAWCAACRKEATELEDAAAVFAFAAAPAEPPPELEDRVVASVRARVRKETGARRRLRMVAGAAILAGIVAVSGFGWGAVMARKADRLAERASRTEAEREAARQFEEFVDRLPFRDARDEDRFVTLSSPGGAPAEGWGLVMVSAVGPDFAGVSVVGLDVEGTVLPYRVVLSDAAGHHLVMTRIDRQDLDRDGAADNVRQFGRDLTEFHRLVVRDAEGHVLLVGSDGDPAATDKS